MLVSFKTELSRNLSERVFEIRIFQISQFYHEYDPVLKENQAKLLNFVSQMVKITFKNKSNSIDVGSSEK